MKKQGFLNGLAHEYENPIQYKLKFADGEAVEMNGLIGQTIKIEYLGKIHCVNCQRVTNKSFNSGYCYPCFKTLAENDLCIVKPHECHFHLGTCRDEAFALSRCMIPHYVYLSLSSGAKVGLTRKGNEQKRWVDQGAVKAVPIAELPTRKMAGELEFTLSQSIKDKTDWRKMLKGDFDEVDLLALRDEAQLKAPEMYRPYFLTDNQMYEFVFPHYEKIEKITSYNLDKEPMIEDKLIGIKGNYFIFSEGVVNAKKYSGYEILFETK